MKKTINIGYIGLGRRGVSMLRECFAKMKDVHISILCDLVEARLERGRQTVLEQAGYEPAMTTDYRDILKDPSVDAVVIMTGWSGRPDLARACMEAGKYTAIEVGCADTLQQCWDLVETYERTGVPLMMLENCCYGRREMMVLNMVKQGVFGELVHCSGGYMHYLPDEDLFSERGQEEAEHYRLAQYIRKNCENYPTHELGPISKVLSINRGNRMVSLSSFSTKSVGLKYYAEKRFGADSEQARTEYKQGDVVNTIITCAGGQTILLTLDTTLPRAYYSRGFTVRGTKAMSGEERKVIYLEGMKEGIADNEKDFYEAYDHPLHREYQELGPRSGHDGMDWLVCRAFIESVKNGVNTPIDVYDAAAWMAVGCLSEQSIAGGGVPMDFPDFTGGKWENREPVVTGKYCLDEICEDPTVSIF